MIEPDGYNAIRYTRGGAHLGVRSPNDDEDETRLSASWFDADAEIEGEGERERERGGARRAWPVCKRIYGKSLSTSNSLNSLARSLARQQRHHKTSLFSGNFSGIVTVNNVHLTFSFSLRRIVNPSSPARSLFRS